MSTSKNRRLAAILFADIVGYTSLMQKDEITANQNLEKFHQTLNEKVSQYKGQIINNYGDGCVCTFDSAVDAMHCAKDIQSVFQETPKVPVRIGLHSGDVYFKDDNVYGDSVNIASRIESLGVAGAVLFSKRIKRDIANQTEFKVQSLGEFDFKNVEKTMEVFGLANEGLVLPKRSNLKGKLKTKSKTPLMLAIFLGLLTIAAMTYFGFLSQSTIDTPNTINAVTIFPFDVKGSEEIQYLAEGMVDLISTKLDGIPNINPVDPNLVFSKLEHNTTPELPKAISISKELGAAKFILGSIIELNDLLQYTVSEYDINGQLLAKKSIDGSKADLVSTIDELTKTIIAEELNQEGQEFNSLAALTSNSLPALKNYLLGEQAYRKTNPDEALAYYINAVEQDSTFAMAWMRLKDANGWSPMTNYPDVSQNLNKYKNKLPQKWQDLLRVNNEYYYSVKRGGVAAYQALIDKYGECREFTNEIGEYLFHLNPVWGQPNSAAKPWLRRTYELDPLNKESFIHLMDIAFAENDIPTMKNILAATDSTSQYFPMFKTRLLSTQDTVLESEIVEITKHPYFRPFWLALFMKAPDNPKKSAALSARFAPYHNNEIIKNTIDAQFYGIQGKEKLDFKTWKKNEHRTDLFASEKVYFQCLPATLIANADYFPLSEQYESLFEQTKKLDSPWHLFAAIKYCMALNKGTVCEELKTKLLEKTKSEPNSDQYKYFWYSLQAFESKLAGDLDQALIHIDSAFNYSPDWWPSQVACLDKLFMQADIYEQYQNYDKSITLLENFPANQGYDFSKGYATYRLTKLYELNGDIDRAIYKSELFLDLYQDCDEKYKPWVAEVTERRNRLMGKVN